MILSVAAFLPMLECLQVLCQVTQRRDVYLHDVADAIRELESDLHNMYISRSKSFTGSKLKLWSHLSSDASPLVFQGTQDDGYYCVYRVASHDGDDGSDLTPEQYEHTLSYEKKARRSHSEIVDEAAYAVVQARVEKACKKAVKALKDEIDTRFPAVPVLDALSVVQWQYWVAGTAPVNSEDDEFKSHLEALAAFYGSEKSIGDEPDRQKVKPLIDGEKLLDQAGDFVKRVKEKCRFAQTSAELWCLLDEIPSTSQRLSEFRRIALIALTLPVGSVECERLFSCMNMVTLGTRNRLGYSKQLDNVGRHLNTCLSIAHCPFTLANFPMQDALEYWKASASVRGRYGLEA